MEALVAVGLASNVLQFFEFTTKLIRISNELRHDAASSENRDHQVIATHLEGLAQGIKDSAQLISQTSTTLSPEEKALQDIVDRCCGLAKELLNRLEKCGIQPIQNASRLRRAKVAFKALWNKNEIQELSTRLQFLRSEINLHYTIQIKSAQLDQQARQPTKDDIQAVQRSIDGLETLIDSLKHDIDGAASNRSCGLISSITSLQTENSRMHNQAAQQAFANHISLSEKLDDLQSAMAAINTNLGNVQSRQSETFESVAQVRVQNSEFLAKATQQIPQSDNSSASFQDVIRPLFEEFMERTLAGTKKEYQFAARSEADHLLKDVLHALSKMQYGNSTVQGHVVDATDEDNTGLGRETPKSRKSSVVFPSSGPQDRDIPCQLNKGNIAIVYMKKWRRENSLGRFFLMIRESVKSGLSGRAISLYELRAQFIPAPCWFTKGYSITYESLSDARGSPAFGLKLKTYSVLEEDHDAFRAIYDGDVVTLQSMLSQKLISPSDRNEYGLLLLQIDFNIPDCDPFLNIAISELSQYVFNSDVIDRCTAGFDAIIEQRIGCDKASDTVDIPVAFAVWDMQYHLREAHKEAPVGNHATPTLSVFYRGYHADTKVARCLTFLEHVLSRGIAERPDSIFDSYHERTISDLFYDTPWEHIWWEILEEHGFDVDWVYNEDERRKRVVTGDTSAHEVSIGIDTLALQDVKRRRGYENLDE
ncbi:hypothetical protein GGR53DRAFT_518105 [Hypoxylon sp. FL1150]|nr:hypothetical protein GGR53DRAFT_518105 [Hypoxylon sp. FL1150]